MSLDLRSSKPFAFYIKIHVGCLKRQFWLVRASRAGVFISQALLLKNLSILLSAFCLLFYHCHAYGQIGDSICTTLQQVWVSQIQLR